ncbi:hypothetical protein P175DRAFT_0504972 [Aspergillus ochraceoroseus IBT 24754]|uniref:Uncharacterized protein n=2 Tax=Aspergillus ochraceoroseus TaxID=138278 RepID=A0A2T5LLR9_9EURO|nr:uncharacterized protein P175DRAFT_0504972 [Aspergillus ochraceoroseus IBT 24754]KKK22593.1 hypothetical protein AOCH_007504 [Aspergillus ochraceoroseus]PTU17217.1 hypothetical protein P175DRAFT_0504972 [Aspergillus ochraceoroseus IBT 24754]
MPTSSAPPPTTPTTAESLESDLLAYLASTATLEDLHATLLCSLQRLGWTEKIRRLALELLRAGRCERFDEVVEAVVASAEGRKHPVFAEDEKSSNGTGEAEPGSYYFAVDSVDVRIPESVVEQGVRALKDVLREVVVLGDDGDGEGTGNDRTAGESGGAGLGAPGKGGLNHGDTSPAKKGDKKSKSGKASK